MIGCLARCTMQTLYPGRFYLAPTQVQHVHHHLTSGTQRLNMYGVHNKLFPVPFIVLLCRHVMQGRACTMIPNHWEQCTASPVNEERFTNRAAICQE